jgi:hypothetical protein
MPLVIKTLIRCLSSRPSLESSSDFFHVNSSLIISDSPRYFRICLRQVHIDFMVKNMTFKTKGPCTGKGLLFSELPASANGMFYIFASSTRSFDRQVL